MGELRSPALVPAALLCVLLSASTASAQISPGALSRPHQELDGSGDCLSCHRTGEGVARQLCLDCHKALATRIEASLGLHAQAGYDACQTCHIEHHGRDFELIWWGKAGVEAFDHGLTSFPLEGAHAASNCRDCHRAERIVDKTVLESEGVDLARTFLGLSATCLGCHFDEHRGQVEPDGCFDCHTADAWSPATAFDHDLTAYPLRGSHRTAECRGCHQTRSADEPSPLDGGLDFLDFAVAEFAECTACHQDEHGGRLGSACHECHSPLGWSHFDARRFDHNLTAFPLEGAHAAVTCQACHPPGAGLRVERFSACTDCHADPHLRQFESAEDCSDCHTIDGFLPTTYSIAAHQESGYVLAGAHLATPCDACHAEAPSNSLLPSGEFGSPGWALPAPLPALTHQFRFESTACKDCHLDPHQGEVNSWIEATGCEGCHQLESWRLVTFDHDQTALPLRGGHSVLACAECHAATGDKSTTGVTLNQAQAACLTCHDDPHDRQFATATANNRCASCHAFDDWTAPLFDHDRDAAFALQGAHRGVSCEACHPAEERDDGLLIRYRPLGSSCESCHSPTERSTS